eukprot:scaffold4638_cov125-Skeletonema_dohrnii-CCMP3373.AAC.2
MSTLPSPITIPSYPPNQSRPSPSNAARHICQEARLVLTSLRGGPPYVARGDLALGLKELRGLVRTRFLSSSSSAAAAAAAAAVVGEHENAQHGEVWSAQQQVQSSVLANKGEELIVTSTENDDNTTNNTTQSITPRSSSSVIRIPPPPSPVRASKNAEGPLPVDEMNNRSNNDNEEGGTTEADRNNSSSSGTEPTTVIDNTTAESNNNDDSNVNNNADDEMTTPRPTSPVNNPSTPHSVPASPDGHYHRQTPGSTVSNTSSIGVGGAGTDAGGGGIDVPPMPPYPLPHLPTDDQLVHNNTNKRTSSSLLPMPSPTNNNNNNMNDPGPYARPFLAVIVDPRAAGPHTLVALNSLYRLLESGSIVQIAHSGGGTDPQHEDATTKTNSSSNDDNQHFETTLEAIAQGVLACRFEQTDAHADEAVEMAIADLLRLLVELDACGPKYGELVLVRQLAMVKRGRELVLKQQQQGGGGDDNKTATPPSSKRSTAINTPKVRVQRLPSAVLMEAFHSVFMTRHTFVHSSGGHHSPALAFHFEQVLMKMIHCVFGGEDNGKAKRMSTRHLGAGRQILGFLIDQLLTLSKGSGGGGGSGGTAWYGSLSDIQEKKALCLRLIQCCLKTGWGGDDSTSSTTEGGVNATNVEDKATLALIEDDLCLALLTTGQAVWAHLDEFAQSSSSGDILGSPGTSLEVLSEVCAALSLLWSLPLLRSRLCSQFESIFSGFYQRALSLLRRRPLPEDGAVYQANVLFDSQVEVILESLVDILSLHGMENGPKSVGSMSTLEELFLAYDCSPKESDVASGLLVELSRCCGGNVDEDGESILPSMSPSRSGSSGQQTPTSQKSGFSSTFITRHRPVPDHLKELCFEALLGSLRRLFHGVESLSSPGEEKKEDAQESTETTSPASKGLREAKNHKRLLHHAARLFNEKSKKGFQYLVDHGILPNPVTPHSVAAFLRTGLVVGLDKAAVGQYLGEIGKDAAKAEKPPPVWELDWFHKEILTMYCSSFGFENQSLLDSLRMFLAAFRLPGEAQMIDRILQGFSESVGRVCEESMNGSLKLFSSDEKRAADAAYLLSFSIIMLNTDLHNENIRPDRKMKVIDFVRNNKNYGKEISDRDLPVEYLEGIYKKIKEEQIRTLGEGADGSMTLERWKDVMKNTSSFQTHHLQDTKDVKELLIESAWQPVLSAMSGLWGMIPTGVDNGDFDIQDQNGTLQGARFGIDLANEILSGASSLGRQDIFQDLFINVCYMSGLLGNYNMSTEERTYCFVDSLERQSALIVAINTAVENGDIIGLDGWKYIWGMIFELRDLQLLSGKNLKESDPDLLTGEARIEFSRRLMQLDEPDVIQDTPRKGIMSLVFGTGSSDSLSNQLTRRGSQQSLHGKEDLLLWDEIASSDEEDEPSSNNDEYASLPYYQRSPSRQFSSVGTAFENQLFNEMAYGNDDLPVTGLERIDSRQAELLSPRGRVRNRLANLVDFNGLISETRYLCDDGLSDTLNALIDIIRDSSKNNNANEEAAISGLPISPASEAFAEILLCEVVRKNRDRFAFIWENILSAHYNSRLTCRPEGSEVESDSMILTPGIEKCVSGILKICIWASSRNVFANEVLPTLEILHPPLGACVWSPLELNLDKHLSEGLWRICRNVDGLSQIDDKAWEGILGLLDWCASRGGIPSRDNFGSLDEDDPSLQAFRSLHLMLHAEELKDIVPYGVVKSIRSLVEAGERGHCPKLSIAGLDLLQLIHTRMETLVIQKESELLLHCWNPTVDAVAEPAEKSRNGVSNVFIICAYHR